MARIPEDFIQTLLDRTDIVDVIERYVPLKKAGANNYQARCPFHSEKSPSFTVSPLKQFYHCFGCGAHGTAITFLMEHTGMSFPDAVRELAQRIGMQVPESQDEERDGAERQARNRTLETLEKAALFYRDQLKASGHAVEYLKQRGLTGETAARFLLGYAPDDWHGLRRVWADYQDIALDQTGLVISGDGKRYDRFRDRIMFPIRNEQGRVIAFGGRIIDAGEPKYLNSPETELFHKGRELYGLSENRRGIQKADQVLVVEGYMDVVMLAQHGVDNAVASLGTAITADQVRRLFRLTDNIIFAFDGDAAGRRAAWRALENALPQLPDGKRAGFLFLPESEDPDSFVRQQGADAFRKLCGQTMPLSEFLLAELKTKTDLGSQEGKVRLAKLAEPYIGKLGQAPLLAAALRRSLAELSGLSTGRRYPVVRTGDRAPGRPPRTSRLSPWHTLLCAVLHEPGRARELADLPRTTDPEGAILHTLMEHLRGLSDGLSTRDLVEMFRGSEQQPILERAASEIMRWDQDHDALADMRGALLTVREQAGRATAAGLSGKKPSELSQEERDALLASLRIKKPLS
ncbi:MAG TPA: DNA primase [Thiobacillaceae bacterium]|nr:DNA primase [Thiobacillaceae bacterium]